LVDTAPHVGTFVARLFGVEAEHRALLREAEREAPIFRMKDQVVKRRAVKRGEVAPDPVLDGTERGILAAAGVGDGPDELDVARFACRLLDLENELKQKAPPPEAAAWVRAAARGVAEPDDRKLVARAFELFERWLMMRRPELRGWVSFRLPHAVHHDDLVKLRRPGAHVVVGPEEHRRHRDRFRLTDPRISSRHLATHSDYCLSCHNRDKDSCSKGLRDKDGAVKPNPLGIPLSGCPLGEKISEMHLLRRAGDSLGALALITVDNPMAPGTGHRICNDCMKA